MKLFEYSVTTVAKSSSNWAYQPTPNLTLPLFTTVTSSNYESIPTPFVTRTLLFTDFCRAAIVWSSVVQLLVTYGLCHHKLLMPFCKNMTARGPLLIKWCIKIRLSRLKKENRWVKSVCHWNYYTIAIKIYYKSMQCLWCEWPYSQLFNFGTSFIFSPSFWIILILLRSMLLW